MYFIMLRHPNGKPMPIVEDEDNIKLFESYEKAEEWTADSGAAQAYGYEIYEW